MAQTQSPFVVSFTHPSVSGRRPPGYAKVVSERYETQRNRARSAGANRGHPIDREGCMGRFKQEFVDSTEFWQKHSVPGMRVTQWKTNRSKYQHQVEKDKTRVKAFLLHEFDVRFPVLMARSCIITCHKASQKWNTKKHRDGTLLCLEWLQDTGQEPRVSDPGSWIEHDVASGLSVDDWEMSHGETHYVLSWMGDPYWRLSDWLSLYISVDEFMAAWRNSCLFWDPSIAFLSEIASCDKGVACCGGDISLPVQRSVKESWIAYIWDVEARKIQQMSM